MVVIISGRLARSTLVLSIMSVSLLAVFVHDHVQRDSLSIAYRRSRSSSLSRQNVISSSTPIIRCNSTRGAFHLEVSSELCPRGAKQLLLMVESAFLDQRLAFWRVNKWITQFGADMSPAARQKEAKRRGNSSNFTDPFAVVRRGSGNDPHPACRRKGILDAEKCREASSTPEREDISGAKTVAGRINGTSTGLAEELLSTRKAEPWPRGTLAVIGPTALLVVRRGNANMGTAPHDCPVARIVDASEGLSENGVGESTMARVFDRLYDGYGNGVDTKSGPDQRRIFREGLGPLLRDYPKLDVLESCKVLL